ncbi:MAG TPA: F0F1 ATP synthase subunit epsilon [Nocardioidaceae bacterium]|jgi:F-type H+-transporting ATPase subunit epsilon|nr:F0F1 ATP synthase subunit epsilon [Nocardioidaceae bacterium]
MADDLLRVEVVSADSEVWSGDAEFVLARTTDGELGVLPHHAPLLSVLVESVILIRGEGGDSQVAAIDGGFISVAENRVSILCEQALLSEDIDAGEARQDLERAQGDSDDEDAARQVRWAEARIEATEKAG